MNHFWKNLLNSEIIHSDWLTCLATSDLATVPKASLTIELSCSMALDATDNQSENDGI